MSELSEMLDQVAADAPALLLAPRLVAVDAHRKAAADYRKRVSDSHRWQATSLGMDDPGPLEDDPMGNMILTGHIYGSNAAEIVKALSGQQTTDGTQNAAQVAAPLAGAGASSITAVPSPAETFKEEVKAVAEKTLLQKALPYVLMAAIGGGTGSGAIWLANKLAPRPNLPASAPVQPQSKVGISLIPSVEKGEK